METLKRRLENLIKRFTRNEGLDKSQAERLTKLENEVDTLKRQINQRVKTLGATE